jgi:hypothetical protein
VTPVLSVPMLAWIVVALSAVNSNLHWPRLLAKRRSSVDASQ